MKQDEPTMWEALNSAFPDKDIDELIDKKIDACFDLALLLFIAVIGVLVLVRVFWITV